MSTQLYVRSPKNIEKVRGPFSRSKLQDLVEKGKLRQDFEVSLDQQKWLPITKVKPPLFKKNESGQVTGTPPSKSSQSSKMAVTPVRKVMALFVNIFVIGGIVVLLLFFAVEVVKNAQLVIEPEAAVVIPDWHVGKWTQYVDPKGRFSCDVPPGWEIETLDKGPQSELKLSIGGHKIRATVRETKVHEMYAGIEQEMTEGMARPARSLGSDGKVGNVEWTTLAGSRALQIDMESKTRERFSRTIKAKHGGYDHFIGMYVEPSSQREELCDLFEEFLSRYGGGR